MRKPMLWMCLVLLVCAAAAVADPVPYEITGEVRVRNENDDRDFNSATGYKSFNYMRTRLGIDVKPADAMNVFVQVQDSRVQGLAETSTVPGEQQDSKLDLHQGFFEVNDLGWTGFGIKAGRMEVRFGNERLIGTDDWDNISTTFDGVAAHVSREHVEVQALFANLVENDSPVVGTPANNSDATLQGVYGSFGVRPNTNADVFVINKRDKVTSSPDDDMDVVTFGSRVHGTGPSRIDYSVEGSYQMGSQETGPTTQNDIAAYMFGGEVGMTFGDEVKPVRLGAGYDYLSGDNSLTDTKTKNFNTLFGDVHRYYGLMDVVNPNSMVAGLQDLKVNVQSTVFKNENNAVRVGGEFHNFRLAQAGTGESAVGNEVDVNASWAYRERFVPTVGMSAFIPGKVLDPSPTVQADNSYWIYAQGVVSF